MTRMQALAVAGIGIGALTVTLGVMRVWDPRGVWTPPPSVDRKPTPSPAPTPPVAKPAVDPGSGESAEARNKRLVDLHAGLGLRSVAGSPREAWAGTPLVEVPASEDTHAFRAGGTEVTVAQFRAFLRDLSDAKAGTKLEDEALYDWLRGLEYEYPEILFEGKYGVKAVSPKDGDPMVNVNLHDALVYCRWLSRKEKRPFAVPLEAEWEQLCKAKDATGGVWEWCRIDADIGHDGVFGLDKDPEIKRPVRGGSSADKDEERKPDARRTYPTYTRRPDLGFRVVSAEPKKP